MPDSLPALFLSTLSLRRATLLLLHSGDYNCHFYPRSPCGERPPITFRHCTTYLFLSTLSLRRATVEGDRFFYYSDISIHALLAESDNNYSNGLRGHRTFLSTLSLRRATDDLEPSKTRKLTFLSTLSLRRATRGQSTNQGHIKNFYPRSPCGERRVKRCQALDISAISIHALLAESDDSIGTLRTVKVNFYPRSPCGERP